GQAQHAYWDALAQHGNSEHGAKSGSNRVESEIRIAIHIGDVNCTTFEQGTSGDTAAVWRDSHLSPAFHDFGGVAVRFGAVEHAINLAGNRALVGVAQACR